MHILYGEGGLFYTEKGTHFARRRGTIVHGEACLFYTDEGPVFHREGRKFCTFCSEKKAYFA